jgi:hypothetical protein
MSRLACLFAGLLMVSSFWATVVATLPTVAVVVITVVAAVVPVAVAPRQTVTRQL